MKRRGGLGRGLSALIPGATEESGLLEIPVAAVTPNSRQPRGRFEGETLEALARSIREVGVLQPVVVRPLDVGYQLVAGERRLRAAKLAGLATIPAVIRETDDTEALREALIENLHREDLAPLEQAAAFQELLDDLGASHDELAERLGHSRSHVTNTIRLLQLAPAVQRLLAERKLSAGHARALLGLEDEEAQEALALRATAEGLSVRRVEELVGAFAHGRAGGQTAPKRAAEPDPRLAEAQEQLADALATQVTIQRGRRKGKIVIEFGSDEDLERILGIIGRAG